MATKQQQQRCDLCVLGHYDNLNGICSVSGVDIEYDDSVASNFNRQINLLTHISYVDSEYDLSANILKILNGLTINQLVIIGTQSWMPTNLSKEEYVKRLHSTITFEATRTAKKYRNVLKLTNRFMSKSHFLSKSHIMDITDFEGPSEAAKLLGVYEYGLNHQLFTDFNEKEIRANIEKIITNSGIVPLEYYYEDEDY